MASHEVDGAATVTAPMVTPQTSHVQGELPRSDVPCPYGTVDAASSYGLRLAEGNEGQPFDTPPPVGYANTPVLVSRGSATKGAKGPLVCHVQGCQRDLSTEKKYYKRYRVCMEHLKMRAIYVDGELQRFCQQCGRFHDLGKFDGDKRNCRERLNQHNRRRRKSKREAGGSDGSWDDFSQEEPTGKVPKGRRSKRLIQTTSSPVWTGTHSGFDVSSHGMMSEEQRALGSVGMDMMQGIPVGASAASLHPFDGLTLTAPEGHSEARERESLYNMVMHHVMPNAQSDAPTDPKAMTGAGETSTSGKGLVVPTPIEDDSIIGESIAVSEAEATTHSLTNLLHVPETASSTTGTVMEVPSGSHPGNGAQNNNNNSPFVNVQGGMGMLQSVCMSSPGGSMPTVPMLVFPSTPTPHQLSAVALLSPATSACSTIVPISWHGPNQAPQAQQPLVQVQRSFVSASVPSPPLPIHPLLPHVEPSVSPPTAAVSPAGVEGPNEIPPIVSLALSASGIAQATGQHAHHSAISPNQLAHFQMLMARQISIGQTPDVMIPPQTTTAVVRETCGLEEELKPQDTCKDEMPSPK